MKRQTGPARADSPIPLNFTKESFYGFDMTDEQVGPGDLRLLAVEVKHLFEGMAEDADQTNEEMFLTKELDHALRRFLVDPSKGSLDHLLEVSPTLIGPCKELSELIRIANGSPKGS